MANKIERLEQIELELNSFDLTSRMAALGELQKLAQTEIREQENVNLHFHSFYSYNAEFWSPSRIAWESKKNALYATGIIDFDVLSGMDEFFRVGEILELRTNVGVETRVFLDEYAHKEIDSPGEPGVSYVAGAGFYKTPGKDSSEAATLKMLSSTAESRNLALIQRINQRVPEIAITYKEVTPLTPAGNATERHIVSAYIQKASEVFPDINKRIEFWAKTLDLEPLATAELINIGFKFEDKVRSKFAKKGGFGYVQPSSETFPPMQEFFDFVKACGAIPMESWLDGTSEGEKDCRAMLELSKSKGAAALNLIPDRNWNIADSKVKAVKTQNLKNIIETAVNLDMPIHIGTEMNKKGLPFVDDLNGADLNPYKEIFLNGARIIVGHTLLGRFSGFNYLGEKAEREFGSLKKRNDFFVQVGALPGVNKTIGDKLRNAGPEKAFSMISDSAKRGKWIV